MLIENLLYSLIQIAPIFAIHMYITFDVYFGHALLKKKRSYPNCPNVCIFHLWWLFWSPFFLFKCLIQIVRIIQYFSFDAYFDHIFFTVLFLFKLFNQYQAPKTTCWVYVSFIILFLGNHFNALLTNNKRYKNYVYLHRGFQYRQCRQMKNPQTGLQAW